MIDFLNWFHRESGIPENDDFCAEDVERTSTNPLENDEAVKSCFETESEEVGVFDRLFSFLSPETDSSPEGGAVAAESTPQDECDATSNLEVRAGAPSDGIAFGDLKSVLCRKESELHSMDQNFQSLTSDVRNEESKLESARALLKSRLNRANQHIGCDDHCFYLNDVHSAEREVESRLRRLKTLNERADSMAREIADMRSEVRSLKNKLNA